MDKKILIISNSDDLHVDLVVEQLIAKGVSYFRLNLDQFPAHYEIDMQYEDGAPNGALRHLPTQSSVEAVEVGAVWTRKSADFKFSNDELGAQELAYAKAETEHILTSLLLTLDAYWMNHPLATRCAMWKGEQLLRAARAGFKVPPSLATTRGEAVRRFRAAVGGEIIFKPLSSPDLGADLVDHADRVSPGLATTLITDEHDEMLDALSVIPGFFQQHIPKRYELRVTVIGQSVFAASIHSQDDERTRTDYRDFSAEIRYETADLPLDVQHRCRDFVHSYGLMYGALDLIVTPAGDYVFLENNPAGQFLFVEQLVPELRMIDAVVECLIAGARPSV